MTSTTKTNQMVSEAVAMNAAAVAGKLCVSTIFAMAKTSAFTATRQFPARLVTRKANARTNTE